jgi:hypothetical protein
MIAIPCNNCNHIIDIEVQDIKVTCYLLLCQSCQIEAKNNERDKKLKKILKRSLKERIKFMIR